MFDLLRRELGARAVLSPEARWLIEGRAPVAVVQPEHTEQVASVLALCAREGIAVEAAGAGGWLNRGPVYDRDYILLSTAQMAGVIEYEPEDLTIGVQAGMPLHKLQHIVGANGQMVALDPPAHQDGTVGAVAALASAGPLRCLYGTPRDHVLGLDAVTGDGRVLQVGGRVVKNVAGYDVTRLLVGSHGTLAVLTRVNLRLRPRPRHDVTWTISANNSTSLLEVAAELYEAAFEPAAVELVRSSGEWQLAVRVHGNDEAIAHARSTIATSSRAAAKELPNEKAGQFWCDLSAHETSASICMRLSHLPTKLPKLIAEAAEAFPDARIFAHVYDGIVRVCADADGDKRAGGNQLEDAPDADKPAIKEKPATPIDQALLRDFRDQVIDDRGTVIFSALPPRLARELPRYGPLGNEVRLMEGVKRALDPAAVLAPGRFVL